MAAADYRNAMSGAFFGHVRERMPQWLAGLLRMDRWPQQAWTRIERAREVLGFAYLRAREVRLAEVAGSLTFTTMLSIVPLLAVVLSVFSAFPLFAETRLEFERLVGELLPPQIAATIVGYIAGFAARAAGLTALGVLFLFVTALLMIYTVDAVLNEIWKVQQVRGWMARILVYWALLTVGPLAVGASLSATTYLLALPSSPLEDAALPLRLLLDVGPFALGGVALAALYVVVPNRRVRWRDALVGGFVASALGELLSWGFGLYIRTGSLVSIYGAFSALPLLLLWIYLSWYALLFGAAIAATLPMLRATRFADERRAGNRFLTAAALLRSLLLARSRGVDDGRVSAEALAREVRVAEDAGFGLLLELERLGYASRLDGAHAGKWLLTCDPRQATLLPLFRRLALDPGNSLLAAHRELASWLAQGLRSEWLLRPLADAFGVPQVAGDEQPFDPASSRDAAARRTTSP
jgi:membrane protein